MRDCRKFIHYEFSPPFASSESSVSEVDSPETRETFIKKLGRKKMRAERTQSMTEELLSPQVTSSYPAPPVRKRGRPPIKSKSTDFRETEVVVLDEDTTASPEVVEVVEEVKKRKRGRPPKKRPPQARVNILQSNGSIMGRKRGVLSRK